MQLSSNFRSEEFACKDGCGGIIVDARLLLGLQEMRSRLAHPIVVTSGYRCLTHNMRVGGERNSKHLLGIAADITTSGSLEELLKLALEIEQFNGIAIDRARNFIHVDVRNGPRVKWSYKNGVVAPWE